VPDASAIRTERLQLVAIGADALTSLLNSDVDAASELQGFRFPSAFLDAVNDAFLAGQLKSIALTPSGQDWSVRAIVREQDDAVIGHCGFHGPPDVVGRAEIGYTIFPDYRDNGYATEAVHGLVSLARENGSKVVFAAVSPDNPSSIRVVEKVGFHQTGLQGNKGDGEEFVFEMIL
jgi:RimJ/RimL family protein N-acetyltransferase